MFAINHAAASLIFKKQLNDSVSFIWVLLAVQFIELLWVVLNLFGIEKVITEETVNYVGDIHLSYMPYSHSIISSILIAIMAGIAFWFLKKSWKIGLWMALAFLSHIILDILTHAKDIPIWFSSENLVGLGFYSSYPILGFVFEATFGLLCWWYYKGSQPLFWVIVIFNLFNITMFLPQVHGLEVYMAHKPVLITLIIFAQIVITLFLVGWIVSKKQNSDTRKCG